MRIQVRWYRLCDTALRGSVTSSAARRGFCILLSLQMLGVIELSAETTQAGKCLGRRIR